MTKLANFPYYTPFHTEELLYAANMAVLAKTDNIQVAEQTAFQLQRFAKTTPDTDFGLPANVRDLKTATAVLEISRWATNPALDLYTRYYSFARAVCKLVELPPFDCSKTLSPESPELIGTMNRFEQWLEIQREPLQEKAHAERAWLDSLLRELHLSAE